jgi:hypothetical protein
MNATFARSPIQQDLKYNLPRWGLFMLLLQIVSSAIIPAATRLQWNEIAARVGAAFDLKTSALAEFIIEPFG